MSLTPDFGAKLPRLNTEETKIKHTSAIEFIKVYGWVCGIHCQISILWIFHHVTAGMDCIMYIIHVVLLCGGLVSTDI